MRTKAKVPRLREDADPAVAPEMVERVLQVAAELHAEELTQVRRSELFEAAAQAGIPARYVSAALEQVEPEPAPVAEAPPPAPAPAADDDNLVFAGFFAYLFILGLASAYVAGLLEPWASPVGVDGWGIAGKVLLCAFFWFVGLMVGGMAMEAASRR
ncbi:MAG TPA: hypothetical protein VFR81_27730 [Longimicrobium sp.]|nr:hypothetical protein [Longimicrobium sp.]